MGLEIEYDLEGCRGVITRRERSNVPSVLALVLGVPLLGAVLGALWFAPLFAPFLLFFGGMLLFGGTQSKSDPHYYEKEGPAHNWVFAKRDVGRSFSVEDGVLTFEGIDGEVHCPLAGATIEASESGVLVSPTLGDPIALFWDAASSADVEVLRLALAGAAGQKDDGGTERDVPAALRALEGRS